MELKSNDNIAVRYHKIFDYKLTKEEATKWQYRNQKTAVKSGKSKIRLQREKYSRAKLIIAKEAAKIISRIPTVKFVGITGSLAMMNSDRDSDIDFIIITSYGTLWLTRLSVYFVLFTKFFVLRRAESDNERDALCLNMWFDESDLIWNKKDRNIYTSHEIAQIVPLINKNKTYEKFLYINRWILSYWPNAVVVQSTQYIIHGQQKLSTKYYALGTIFEKLAYKLQYWYMSKKMTREVVTPTRAIFHPNDWGKKVLTKLKAID